MVLNGGGILLISLFYALNELVVKSWTDHWFVHWYVNDILAGIWLPALLMFLAAVFRVRRILNLNARQIVLVVLIAGLFWELIAPFYVTDSVRDPFDVLAYVAGGFIYLLLSKRIPW